MDFQIQNLLPVVTLHGLRVRFGPPSLQRSCSRWSWDPQNNQCWCLMTSCLSAHRLSSFQSLMLKGKDNITSFFSPNVETFAGDPHWPGPLFAYHDLSCGMSVPDSMSDKKDLSACRLHVAVSQHFSHSSASSTESWKRRSCRKFSWNSCEHVNV